MDKAQPSTGGGGPLVLLALVLVLCGAGGLAMVKLASGPGDLPKATSGMDEMDILTATHRMNMVTSEALDIRGNVAWWLASHAPGAELSGKHLYAFFTQDTRDEWDGDLSDGRFPAVKLSRPGEVTRLVVAMDGLTESDARTIAKGMLKGKAFLLDASSDPRACAHVTVERTHDGGSWQVVSTLLDHVPLVPGPEKWHRDNESGRMPGMDLGCGIYGW